jgi:hypothetical protein
MNQAVKRPHLYTVLVHKSLWVVIWRTAFGTLPPEDLLAMVEFDDLGRGADLEQLMTGLLPKFLSTSVPH